MPAGAQTVLRRKSAGDQRHGVGEPRLERLAKDVDPLRQLNPVETILQIGVIAADMDLTERVLRDSRRLQQQLVQRLVVALRLGLDRGAGEIINGGAKAGLDLLACDVELLGNHLDIQRQTLSGRWGRLLCSRRISHERYSEGSDKDGGHATRPRANRVGHWIPLNLRGAQQGCCARSVGWRKPQATGGARDWKEK